MEAVIYLDTHVVVWLYAEGAAALPEMAVQMLEEASEIRISPMVRLELQYLYEIGRVNQPALIVLDALESSLGLSVCHSPFSAIVREAEAHSWTRDPFDRIIVAHAALHDAQLLTKDETIRANYAKAVWPDRRLG